ncbi:uncharacterized protein LOC121412294 [Lytechinus variegatus]|uniref:uncharacterized protein LOC121412294 n=1 Tax=Lytechinus variegatus TaxID=7654 RepID=UPI001BB21907|nr:uncharacterized protein LOC121412294 [Lytechinus variegatus]
MDSSIKMYLFALVALGSLSVATAVVECYSCSYTYNADDDVPDPQNCVNPSTTTTPPTNTITCADTQRCSVRSTFNTISGTPSSDYITYTRGCDDITSVCDTTEEDCRKNPRSCTNCCTGERCNTANLRSHLSANSLSNTCYKCEHTDYPGKEGIDAGCQQDAFQATSQQVTKIECQGLCFSAVALFEPSVAKKIIRGCLPDGADCNKRDTDNGNILNANDGHRYEVACCKGSDCNAATALSVGIATVFLSFMLALIAVRM